MRRVAECPTEVTKTSPQATNAISVRSGYSSNSVMSDATSVHW